MKTFSQNVNTELIAKMYIKSKSKDHNRAKSRSELKKNVVSTSKRYKPDPPEQFFKFDRDTLVTMSERDKRKHPHKERRLRPYLTLYETTQNEAMKSLIEQQTLGLGEVGELPGVMEPDEW